MTKIQLSLKKIVVFLGFSMLIMNGMAASYPDGSRIVASQTQYNQSDSTSADGIVDKTGETSTEDPEGYTLMAKGRDPVKVDDPDGFTSRLA